MIKAIPLYIATGLEDTNGKKIIKEIFIILHDGKPVIMGSGRYANVALASNSSNPSSATEFYAIKFLKYDDQSLMFSQIAIRRFYEEINKTRTFGIDKFDHFVQYVGFSNIFTAPPYGNILREETQDEKEVLEFVSREQYDESAKRNNESVANNLPKEFLDKLQGDFFVMKAEHGTLDDLIIYQHPWRDHKLYIVSDKLGEALTEFRSRKEVFIRKLFNDLNNKAQLEERVEIGEITDFSGINILRLIGKLSNPLKYRIIIDLFTQILASVRNIHETTSEDGVLAHRDIKPGNFLISLQPPEINYFNIKISDLGFVSGVKSIIDGSDTMARSSKEPGALALGTIPFRAPEQIDNGYEIHFTISDENSDSDGNRTTLTFLNIGDKVLEPGDWLESQEVFFGSKENARQITKIEDIRIEDNLFIVTINAKIIPIVPKLYYHAYIVKQTSQHSDIFSLGSILYFLSSGGKNPEKFYTKCLEPSLSQENEDIKKIHGSCMSLAIALCLDETNVVEEEMEANKYTKYSTDFDVELMRFKKQSLFELKEKTVFGYIIHRTQTSRLGANELLHGYLKSMKINPVIRYYLTDSNGKPIPFSILFEIIKCMTRNKIHSYVSTENGNSEGANTQESATSKDCPTTIRTKSFSELDLKNLVGSIYKNLVSIKESETKSCNYNIQPYSELGEPADKILMSLRMCLPLKSKTIQDASTI
ncbi:MAG: hypothetical protein D8M57_05970 [Candidatus Scalindua sp. AMX11]|nr:MAG: hypothetical protein DWQ00_12920 [Candidatus Scalindua sp.]NOG82887.1 hypothetical protein [Planctomycetota bacterium]RZV86228.1 MAG: hypothetical protein EX341_07635 [Candidatus Scalindua sp. SCAELEC01]TDE65849.1 MAG: hypothetical protein D8M57_05970 [Candidatus Scalindua sp. AMX11]GJQ58357.1 MAG: hypothetical protein SCALA701_11580 [Candidatus Scalindua sp.]